MPGTTPRGACRRPPRQMAGTACLDERDHSSSSSPVGLPSASHRPRPLVEGLGAVDARRSAAPRLDASASGRRTSRIRAAPPDRRRRCPPRPGSGVPPTASGSSPQPEHPGRRGCDCGRVSARRPATPQVHPSSTTPRVSCGAQHRMDVRVDEPGADRGVAEVDHPVGSPAPRRMSSWVASGRDPALADPAAVGPTSGVCEGPDPVGDDQVRSLGELHVDVVAPPAGDRLGSDGARSQTADDSDQQDGWDTAGESSCVAAARPVSTVEVRCTTGSITRPEASARPSRSDTEPIAAVRRWRTKKTPRRRQASTRAAMMPMTRRVDLDRQVLEGVEAHSANSSTTVSASALCTAPATPGYRRGWGQRPRQDTALRHPERVPVDHVVEGQLRGVTLVTIRRTYVLGPARRRTGPSWRRTAPTLLAAST